MSIDFTLKQMNIGYLKFEGLDSVFTVSEAIISTSRAKQYFKGNTNLKVSIREDIVALRDHLNRHSTSAHIVLMSENMGVESYYKGSVQCYSEIPPEFPKLDSGRGDGLNLDINIVQANTLDIKPDILRFDGDDESLLDISFISLSPSMEDRVTDYFEDKLPSFSITKDNDRLYAYGVLPLYSGLDLDELTKEFYFLVGGKYDFYYLLKNLSTEETYTFSSKGDVKASTKLYSLISTKIKGYLASRIAELKNPGFDDPRAPLTEPVGYI